MKKKHFLDSVDVPVPCDKSWDEMIGGDVSRFCKHCEKDIYNISAMTRQEAKKLLFQSKERVCIRMEREPDGKIRTLKKQLHQITRQVPLAAGVLTASLILAGATNAQETKIETSKITITQIADKNSKPSISGVITDSNGAVVAGIRILLRNTKNDSIRFATSNDAGFYEFRDVAVSTYEIVISSQNGFQAFVKNDLIIENNTNLELRIALKSGDVVIGQTVYNYDPNVETETPTINTNVTYQEFVPLPVSERMVLGFPNLPIPTKKIKNAKNLSQISFTILDTHGMVIPDAEVKLTNTKTQQFFIVKTNEKGVAYFSLLPRGHYDVKASMQGFHNGIMSVIINQKIEPNIEMSLELSFVTGVVSINWSEIPTFNAIIQDDVENVKKSINSGFSVNTKDNGGKTALHFATESGNLEIVKFLLSKGAKVNAKDKFNRTPIILLDVEDDEEAIEILKLFIAKGADLNVQDKDYYNRTLLMNVCDDENFEMAKILLEAGANPNLKDEDGETAMQKTKSEEIKKLLIKYGAKN